MIPDFSKFTREELMACRRSLDRHIVEISPIQLEPPNGVESFRIALEGALESFFLRHSEAVEWRGTRSGLNTLFLSAGLSLEDIQKLQFKNYTKFLTYLEAEGKFQCHLDDGVWTHPTWVFPRLEKL